MSCLVIGTRGSDLALWGANSVRDALRERHGDLEIRIEVIRTKGDKLLRTALSKIPDKGLFTKEIENALLDGAVDLAVHSLKDLPTEMVEGVELAAVPVREDPADALVGKGGATLDDLPAGAGVLTGSLRRAAQILHRRPDLNVLPVRGNVGTRLQTLDESDAAAIVLARAGLVRLGLAERVSERLGPEEFLPACGQGALAVQIRSGDDSVRERVASLDDVESRAAVTAERAFLSALGGGCQVPIGAYARMSSEDSTLTITGMVASVDGSRLVRDTITGAVDSAEAACTLGEQLADLLLAKGAQEILDETIGQT